MSCSRAQRRASGVKKKILSPKVLVRIAADNKFHDIFFDNGEIKA